MNKTQNLSQRAATTGVENRMIQTSCCVGTHQPSVPMPALVTFLCQVLLILCAAVMCSQTFIMLIF